MRERYRETEEEKERHISDAKHCTGTCVYSARVFGGEGAVFRMRVYALTHISMYLDERRGWRGKEHAAHGGKGVYEHHRPVLAGLLETQLVRMRMRAAE